MIPRPLLLPKLADPAFVAAFSASYADAEALLVLPIVHFDDIGTFSVMLSVSEAEQEQRAGIRRFIALIGEDIRPLMALLTHNFPLPRLKGIALDYQHLQSSLPAPAFTTHIGLVLLAASSLKCPAYALGLSETDAKQSGFQPL